MKAKNILPLLVVLIAIFFVFGCAMGPNSKSGANNTDSNSAIFQDSNLEDIDFCHVKADIKDTIGVKMADSLMVTYPTALVFDQLLGKKGWEYTNGVLFHAFEKLAKETKEVKYLDWVKPYVDRYVLPDGTIQYLMADNVTTTRDKRILDVIQPSILMYDLLKKYPEDPRYLAALNNTKDIFPTIQTNSIGGFFHKPTYPYQMWLDGLYMAEPFISKYGKKIASGADKTAFYDIAVNQIAMIAEKTYDPAKNLFYHAWLDRDGINAYNAANPTAMLTPPAWANATTNLSPEVWSRALGWYAMALVDVLDSLPKNHYRGYREVKEILNNLAVGLERYQDPTTGLWFQVVDKGDQAGNFIETSGSAMFIYALAKGAVKGYIPHKYYKVAAKGFEGLKSYVTFDATGKVTVTGTVAGMSVQNDYANYVNKLTVSNAPQGIAAVLLACTAMEYNKKGHK